MLECFFFFFFFFQAEDGIRDWSVTGVQTCALPILALLRVRLRRGPRAPGGALGPVQRAGGCSLDRAPLWRGLTRASRVVVSQVRQAGAAEASRDRGAARDQTAPTLQVPDLTRDREATGSRPSPRGRTVVGAVQEGADGVLG